ncbi:MAG TPA: hypothetical protein PKK54_00610 [bacterium]|nr:hypothetical protein [bacterium]
MSKKKLSKQQRKERRLKEIQKNINQNVLIPTDKTESTNIQNSLPIKQIKTDLVKNLLFTVFAVVLILIFKKTGYGFDEIKHFLRF